jgi:hypothetical protein
MGWHNDTGCGRSVRPHLVLYAIPGQNGGDTEFFSQFTPAGRFLAYQHVNSEAAATFVPGWTRWST